MVRGGYLEVSYRLAAWLCMRSLLLPPARAKEVGELALNLLNCQDYIGVMIGCEMP